MEWTSIVLALITTISGLFSGVLIGTKKRKAEAANQELDNVQKAIGIWQQIAEDASKRNELLQKQILDKNEELTKAVYELKDAVYYAKKCQYADNCPVLNRIDKLQNRDTAGKRDHTDGNGNHNRNHTGHVNTD